MPGAGLPFYEGLGKNRLFKLRSRGCRLLVGSGELMAVCYQFCKKVYRVSPAIINVSNATCSGSLLHFSFHLNCLNNHFL